MGTTLNADEALARLQEGNQRYVSGEVQRPRSDHERRKEVVGGQSPFAVILACADSRVSPEILFDQGLGDVFVVRVAGNITAPDISGSIEYAVAHLNVKLCVVLGHQNCGAVGATVDGYDGDGDIQTLVKAIQPAVDAVRGQEGDLKDNAIRENARHVCRELAKDEPILAPAVREGGLKVVPAYYSLETGAVTFL